MQVIALASGKGGVGKSVLAANMAIGLAEQGKKVILTDLDLGGSNLHLVIGQNPSELTISSFLGSSGQKMEDIVQNTDYRNLCFISGEGEIPGAANISHHKKKKIINNLKTLDADYLILDLGAGSGNNMLDFFLASGCGIIVTTPTLTATLNAYLFLKNVLFRMLYSCFERNSPALRHLESLKKDGVSLQKVYLSNLLNTLQRLDSRGTENFEEKRKSFHPKVVMNMLDDPGDIRKVDRLVLSVKNYLGISMEFLGVLYRDELQKKALNSRMPVIKYKPNSVLSQGIMRICDKILEMKEEEGVYITEKNAEMSWSSGEMEIEAEADFNNKVNSLEELLHCGALTQGDLVETIRMQQYEINKLKKENRFIKVKLLKAAEQGFSV